MSKTKKVIFTLSMVITVSMLLFALYYVLSPRKVLDQAVESVREEGLEGLKPYVTDDMDEKLDDVLFIVNTPVVHLLLEKAEDLGITEIVIRKFENIEWSVKDVKVGLKGAEIELAYQYEDIYAGTADLTMVFENGKWKIDSVDMPLFDNLYKIKSMIAGK